ncbi:DUF6398 domain-containing protein [Candidatus Bipolaricaulota bacterium]|nr:DUF6398 domain-containing protein [Candidatus Bipolaricaulota bacterium]
MPEQSKYPVPKGMLACYEAIVDLTDAFCRAHLNDEYAGLCRKLTAKLSRKRPSPLMRGRPTSWAGAVLYTIGRVNFLFDKSQTPHLAAKQLCKSVGVSQNTASGKSTEIMRLLKIVPFEPEWTRPSKIDENPMAWMISVDGFILDARSAPREIQEEALRMGLIPYLPDE